MTWNSRSSAPDLFPVLHSSHHSAPDPMALSLQSGLMVTAAVVAAVNLGLAEQIGEQPKSIAALAYETHTHAPSLYLLMKALASIGIFEELDAQTYTFGNTARSLLLLPDAMAPLVRLWGAHYQWDSWRDLTYTITTGKPVMTKHYGEEATIWTYLHEHPEEGRAFQQGLTVNSALIIPELLATYAFSGVRQLVDVGGGYGALAISLLRQYPLLHATLFDRANVIEQAKLGAARDLPEDIAERYHLIAGNFFEAVPTGDCYLLKNVLMDWGDEDYLRLLRTCRHAMDAEGLLLVIEPVLSEQTPFTRFFSLQMAMMMHAAHHRTLEEHHNLFTMAGFVLTNAIPLGLEYLLLEGHLSAAKEEE
jgi:hypothetical protein